MTSAASDSESMVAQVQQYQELECEYQLGILGALVNPVVQETEAETEK